jgi:hypothetical protein
MLEIKVSGTQSECQAFLNVLQERTTDTDINVAIEIHYLNPPPDPVSTKVVVPLVLIQGGKSERKLRSIELPKIP